MEARLRELRVVAETAAQSRENPEVAFKNVLALRIPFCIYAPGIIH
jgi:hypothetical protein